MLLRPRTLLWMLIIATGAASCGDGLPIGPILPIPVGAALVGGLGAGLLLAAVLRHGLLPPHVE